MVHVPMLPSTLHASHWPAHVRLQHTPSRQNPSELPSGSTHSTSAAQGSPKSFSGAQVPACVAPPAPPLPPAPEPPPPMPPPPVPGGVSRSHHPVSEQSAVVRQNVEH